MKKQPRKQISNIFIVVAAALGLPVAVVAIASIAFSTLLSLFILFYLFIGRPVRVVNSSMAPTYPAGSHVVTLILRPAQQLKRGDVVLFNSPESKDVVLIRRVVGLPGESIKITSGKLYINDQLVNESKYLDQAVTTEAGQFLTEQEVEVAPNNAYFLLNDNRTQNLDSRKFGFINRQDITARAAFCYWNCAQ